MLRVEGHGANMDPNQLVTITNNKTKAVKRVKRAELPDYGLPIDYQSQADIYAEGIKKGNGVTLDKVPEAYRGGAQQVLNESNYKADAKTKGDDYGATINFLNNLEKHYQSGGGASYGDSPLARLFGGGEKVKGMLGMNNEAKLYDTQKAGFIASLKGLTGDTGVLTQTDAERLAGLLPGFTSTTGEAKGAFNDVRSQLAAKYGGKKTETTVNPREKNIIEMLLPETSKIPNQGIDIVNKQAQIQQQVGPTKGDLGKSAKSALFQTLGIAPDVLATTAPAATELATAVQLPGMAKGGLEFLKGIPGSFTTAAAAKARSTAAEGVSVKTKDLISAGEKYVNDINPSAKKAWDTLKPAIKDTTNADELLIKLSDWGNKAYTQSGDVRAIAEGQLKEHLYKEGRNIMKKETPEIAKYTDDISKTISRNKLLKKLLVPSAISAGIGIPLSVGMYNLLGQRQSNS